MQAFRIKTLRLLEPWNQRPARILPRRPGSGGSGRRLNLLLHDKKSRRVLCPQDLANARWTCGILYHFSWDERGPRYTYVSLYPYVALQKIYISLTSDADALNQSLRNLSNSMQRN